MSRARRLPTGRAAACRRTAKTRVAVADRRLPILGAAFLLSVLAILFAAWPARADSRSAASARLEAVPVFFVADPSGAPLVEPGADAPTYYLTRTQASLGLGLMRGVLADHGLIPFQLSVGVTDLAAIARMEGEPVFVKPVSTIDAAVAHEGVPLFLVRDAAGSPFTVRDGLGGRQVRFFLAEADARAFVARVLRETKRDWSDIRLSVIGLDVVMNTMLTSDDPAIGAWIIQPSDETRRDAATLRSEARLETPPPP